MIPMEAGGVVCSSTINHTLARKPSFGTSARLSASICWRTASPCHILALLLFPSLCGFPFIFLVEKPLRSPVETASPLLAYRFLPPKPNFSFRFCRLFGGARPLPRAALSSLLASSSATSKRSSSLVAPVSALFRSVVWDSQQSSSSRQICMAGRGRPTPLQDLNFPQHLPLRLIPLLQFCNLHLLPKLLEIPLLPCLGRCLLVRRLVRHLPLYIPHMLITLYHFREIIVRAREGYAFFLEENAGFVGAVETLLIER